MYSVDDLDKVVELQRVPPPDVGAPSPYVLASDHTVLLVYRCDLSSSDNDRTAVIRFRLSWAHYLGAPNDEALHGHPLSVRGLSSYAVYEVLNSSWVRSLERMNSVHSEHDPELFERLRHFIFAFHDNTFECVASGYEVCQTSQVSPDASTLLQLLE